MNIYIRESSEQALPHLSARALGVLIIAITMKDSVSIEHISEIVNESAPTVQKAMVELKEHGLLITKTSSFSGKHFASTQVTDAGYAVGHKYSLLIKNAGWGYATE